MIFAACRYFTTLLIKIGASVDNIRELNGLVPGQARCSVGRDAGPNCSQRSSSDDKMSHKQAKT